MTNEFSGHIVRRLCRIAALEHKNHKNNYAVRILPCSATNSTYSLHLKTRPSWVYYGLGVPAVFRSKAQCEGNDYSLVKHCNALRVNLSALADCIAPLDTGGNDQNPGFIFTIDDELKGVDMKADSEFGLALEVGALCTAAIGKLL